MPLAMPEFLGPLGCRTCYPAYPWQGSISGYGYHLVLVFGGVAVGGVAIEVAK